MKNRFHIIFYFLPYLLILYIIRPAYNHGALNLFVDAKVNFIYTNYFMNHMMRGVYPFWNPFTSWGRPDDYLTHIIGEFNPFLYITLLLKKLGLGFSICYFIYLIIYFSVGVLGVYLLAKRLFNDHWMAWLTAISVMYSNLSGNLFNNILVILIFVPTVWFFYYLISFTKSPRRVYLIGLTFCLMVLFTTYMPFHFLVVFLTFIAFFCCIYIKDLMPIIVRFSIFIQKNRLFTLFCLFSICLSIIPGYIWYHSNLQGDVIYGWRGTEHSLFLGIDQINSGNFIAQHALVSPISNLQDTELCNLYIPFIFVLIVLLGMMLPLTRRRVLLFSLGIFLFLLTSTNASPLMGFLYKYIVIFKHFRNTHFFVWAWLMFITLLVVDIFQGLISWECEQKKQRFGLCLFVFIVHLAALLLLTRYWFVNSSSYVSLVLSCIFFILYFAGVIRNKGMIFYFTAAVIFLLQPTEVLWNINHKANSAQQFSYSLKPNSYLQSIPKFSYFRPTDSGDNQMMDHLADIEDASGFFRDTWQYYGTRWSFNALQKFGSMDEFQEYVRHKFVLYPANQDLSRDSLDVFLKGKWVDSDSDQFKVINFDMNTIKLKTDFKSNQWLVYNDSYHPAWKAFINSRPVVITRANVAFKGIFLPAGPNEVLFSFHSFLYRRFFIFLIIYFHLFLMVLFFITLFSKKQCLHS